MANSASFTIGEYDPKENSTMQLNQGPVTAANYDARRAALDTLKGVMGNISLGEVRFVNLNIKTTESVVEVTDENAQRERKWLVTYRDNTEFLDVADTIERMKHNFSLIRPQYGPCVEPPVPWTAWNDGGWHSKALRRMLPYPVKASGAARELLKDHRGISTSTRNRPQVLLIPSLSSV